MVKVYLYSFASEGLPNDEGLPLLETMKEFQDICINEGKIDKAYYFTPKSIPEEFKWCIKSYDDSFKMPVNIGYHKVGLGAWRSFLLNQALNNSELNEGDVIVIHDPNFKKHQAFVNFAKVAKDYCLQVKQMIEKEEGFLFAPVHCRHEDVYSCTRSCVISSLIPDFSFAKKVAFLPHGRCSTIVAIVNQKSKEFAKLFLETCKNYKLLSPKCVENCQGIHFEGNFFRSHMAEQAVFNTLAYRENAFTKDIKNENSWLYNITEAANVIDMGYNKILLHNNFTFYKSLDLIGNDIYHSNMKLEEMAKISLNDKNCDGFNTLGFFKKDIKIKDLKSSPYFKENDGIYIKNEKLKDTMFIFNCSRLNINYLFYQLLFALITTNVKHIKLDVEITEVLINELNTKHTHYNIIEKFESFSICEKFSDNYLFLNNLNRDFIGCYNSENEKKLYLNQINNQTKKLIKYPYKVVITGMCQNVEEYLPNVIKNMKYMASYFKEANFVIFENGSNDNTKNILKQIKDEDSRFIILNDESVSEIEPNFREKRLCHIRNILLDYTKENFPNTDYYITIDMDEAMSSEKIYGFENLGLELDLSENPDAIFPVSNMYYYDIYAFRDEENPTFKVENVKKLQQDLRFICCSDLKDSQKEMNYNLKINSAFNGCGIYKFESIKNNSYLYIINDNGLPECEHVQFNRKLKTKYINTQFITGNVTLNEEQYSNLDYRLKPILKKIYENNLF